MTDDVLIRFLSKGLINVGGDDEKLGRLRATAGDLAAALAKTPAKTTPFALVAFDPDVPPTDPTIAEVKDALRNRWETYVNTFADTPVSMFRAMLLDAVIRSCEDNATVAAAFVASARNVLPYTKGGGEREIWADLVDGIERRVGGAFRKGLGNTGFDLSARHQIRDTRSDQDQYLIENREQKWPQQEAPGCRWACLSFSKSTGIDQR